MTTGEPVLRACQAFSAHAKKDPVTGHLLNFGISFSVTEPMPRSSKTEEAFSLDIVPRYCLHLVNCHEEGNRLIVDVLEIDREIYREYQTIPNLFETVPPCRPARYIIDLETRRLLDRAEMSYNCAPDFPAIDAHRLGLDYNDFWALGISTSGQPGRKFFDQLIRGSWREGSVCDMYTLPRGEYLGGEPVSIVNPRNPEEAVVVVQHLLPAEDRVDFVVLDAFALKSGPMARLPLRHPIHPLFHTSFRAA